MKLSSIPVIFVVYCVSMQFDHAKSEGETLKGLMRELFHSRSTIVSDFIDKLSKTMETLKEADDKDLKSGLENVLSLIETIKGKFKSVESKTEIGQLTSSFVINLANIFENYFNGALNESKGLPSNSVVLKADVLRFVELFTINTFAVWNRISKDKNMAINNLVDTQNVTRKLLDELKGLNFDNTLGADTLQAFVTLTEKVNTFTELSLKSIKKQ